MARAGTARGGSRELRAPRSIRTARKAGTVSMGPMAWVEVDRAEATGVTIAHGAPVDWVVAAEAVARAAAETERLGVKVVMAMRILRRGRIWGVADRVAMVGPQDQERVAMAGTGAMAELRMDWVDAAVGKVERGRVIPGMEVLAARDWADRR
jgi:predicted RNA-binding protein (virulence factor B family)